jgi:hypothetical protein
MTKSLAVPLLNSHWPFETQFKGYLLLFFLAALWFELADASATPPALFCDRFFKDRVLKTICLGLALNCDSPDLCLLTS